MKRLALLLALAVGFAPTAAHALDKEVNVTQAGGTIELAIAMVVAAGGGVVTLDSLTTYTSGSEWEVPLVIPTGVILRGKGRDRTRLITAAADSDATQLLIMYGDFVGLEDLTVISLATVEHDQNLITLGKNGFATTNARFINVRITNAGGWGVYVMGTADSANTTCIQARWEQVDFINQLDSDKGNIRLQAGNTTHTFVNCVFGGQGDGLLDNGAIKTRIRDCTFETEYDRAHIQATNAKSLIVEGCWFETTAATVSSWFIEVAGTTTHNLTVRDCIFTRTAVGIARLVRTAIGGTQNHMLLDNLFVVTTDSGNRDGNDILLQNDDDTVIIIGGGRVNPLYQTQQPLMVSGLATQPFRVVVRETSRGQLVDKPDNSWPFSVMKGSTP